MHEHVGYFEVSVDDVFLSQVLQPLEDIFDDGSCLMFVEVSLLAQA